MVFYTYHPGLHMHTAMINIPWYSLIPTQTGECSYLSETQQCQIMWMELVENRDAAYLKPLVIMMSCLDDNPKLVLMHPSATQVSIIKNSIVPCIFCMH